MFTVCDQVVRSDVFFFLVFFVVLLASSDDFGILGGTALVGSRSISLELWFRTVVAKRTASKFVFLGSGDQVFLA